MPLDDLMPGAAPSRLPQEQADALFDSLKMPDRDLAEASHDENPDGVGGEEAEVAPAPPASKPLPRFVGNRPRSREIGLDHHIEFDGQVYEKITVRRVTTAEVAAFIDEAAEKGEAARLPMFDCPDEVLGFLDPDDDARVNEVVRDFLPRSLVEGEPS